jgi:hypothetical protein
MPIEHYLKSHNPYAMVPATNELGPNWREARASIVFLALTPFDLLRVIFRGKDNLKFREGITRKDDYGNP